MYLFNCICLWCTCSTIYMIYACLIMVNYIVETILLILYDTIVKQRIHWTVISRNHDCKSLSFILTQYQILQVPEYIVFSKWCLLVLQGYHYNHVRPAGMMYQTQCHGLIVYEPCHSPGGVTNDIVNKPLFMH